MRRFVEMHRRVVWAVITQVFLRTENRNPPRGTFYRHEMSGTYACHVRAWRPSTDLSIFARFFYVARSICVLINLLIFVFQRNFTSDETRSFTRLICPSSNAGNFMRARVRAITDVICIGRYRPGDRSVMSNSQKPN